MGTTILAIVLIVIGVGFLFLGFAGAVKELFKPPAGTTPGQETVSLPVITDLLKALKELLATLISAPQWFLFVLVGAALVAAGGYLIGVGPTPKT